MLNKKFFIVFLSFVLLSVFVLSCGNRSKTDGNNRNFFSSFFSNNKIEEETISYEVDCEPILGFDGQLFPSVILSTALSSKINEMTWEYNSIGNNKSFLGCNIFILTSSENLYEIPVRLEIEGERYISKSVLEAIIDPNNYYKLYPDIVFNYSLIEGIIQPNLENITYRIYCFNNLEREFTKTIQFRSINEVPFLYMQDNGNIIDISFLFAAFVNEDNPIIDQLLKEALDVGIISVINGTRRNDNSFSGYQKDSNGVVDQVFAVWNVLQRRGIKYSSITTTSSAETRLRSQYVRNLTDTLNSNQANCVDGSVLFASVLRKIGIDTFLVLVPGHMMVGFWDDRSHTDPYVIETTMLGNTDLDKYVDDKTFLLGGLAWLFGSSRNEVSRTEFMYALEVGRNRYKNNIEEFYDPYNDDYQIIDISELRREGIKPIPR